MGELAVQTRGPVDRAGQGRVLPFLGELHGHVDFQQEVIFLSLFDMVVVGAWQRNVRAH